MAGRNDKETLFRGLTRLMRSGPLVRRRVRQAAGTQGATQQSSAMDLFKRSQSHVYSNAVNNFGSYDRLSRYADCSEMLYCLSYDTFIALPDGYKKIGEMAEECEADPNKTYVVYAFDHEKQQIVPALAKQPRQTRVDHAWKVTFDSGKEIIGTANHRLMKRDGSYCRIDELVPGDSMMPFYRRDLLGGKDCRETSDGYRWIYTMDHERSHMGNGWIAEHRLIAEWAAGRRIESDEVVHHKNFVKHDNNPENLMIMRDDDHRHYHAEINNRKKWSTENQEWIDWFRKNQSEFMKQNNPAARHDITFGRILEACENVGFNMARVEVALDADYNLIKGRLREQGFKDWITFCKAYAPGWKSESHDNRGTKNPRYNHWITFQRVCDAYESGMKIADVASKLGVGYWVVNDRIKSNGYDNFKRFAESFENHKVVSIEYHGMIPLYDLTVDGYKNFATDSVISHNTPEIACVVSASVISTPSGDFTIEELLHTQQESDSDDWHFPVYAFDEERGCLTIGKAHSFRKTKTDEIVCVTLDDGNEIKCTKDHKFLTRDGYWVEAQDLKEDDSLMPFYRKNGKQKKGYHSVYTINDGWKSERRVVSVQSAGIEDVYDLTVDHYHNFVCNGVVVHNSALDIWADETVANDEKGQSLHVFSDNPQIRQILGELFYDTMNVEFNLRPWVKTLCQYGDFFTFIDVSPDHGVINVFPIPVNEIEREEGFDPEDPMAVRFRWVTQGNQVLENWQVAHFRLLGNDAFLPYGSSVLEPARRIWRQLILIEDAMLVYRIVRSPERRIFYVDVANIPPEDVPSYMEATRAKLRSNQVVDKGTGRVDLRYNPLPMISTTYVPLLNGRCQTLEEIGKNFWSEKESKFIRNDASELWAYSILDEKGTVVPGRIIWCGKNYDSEGYFRITLDDGSWVGAAPEHAFINRDGITLRADELSVGDKLMPFYTKRSSKEDGDGIVDYEKVYDPKEQSWKYTHWMVGSEFCANHGAFANIKCRKVLHHIDFNKHNNHPGNLMEMDYTVHRAYHARLTQFTVNSPELLAERAKRMIQYNKSPEKRARTSQLNKERDSVAAMNWYNGSGLHRQHNENRREGQLKSWSNDREARSKAMRYVVPGEMMNRIKELIIEHPKMGYKRIHEILKADENLMQIFSDAQTVKHDLKKLSPLPWIRYIKEMGYEGFPDFRQAVLEGSEQHVGYKNHEIVSIEWIDEKCEMYCMTVVGPYGENDRHNFAVASFDGSMTDIPQRVGIIVKNSVDEDYFLPIRGTESATKIDTLPGGTHVSAIDDVQYIQSKLFAALKVPKAYLGYDEAICLDKDTRIPLVDGRVLTIEQLAEEHSHTGVGSHWVFAYDVNEQVVVPKRVTDAWKTKDVSELTEVTFDDGTTVRCTPNHPFLTLDGEYVRADQLAVGDAIESVYTRASESRYCNGYLQHWNRAKGRWVYTHRDFARERYADIPKGYIIHHVDFDALNNVPDNLLLMEKAAHQSFHAAMNRIHKSHSGDSNPRYNHDVYAGNVSYSCFIDAVRQEFGSVKEAKRIALNNHQVQSVKTIKLDEPRAVYDLTVEDCHNFGVIPYGTQALSELKTNQASKQGGFPSGMVIVSNSSKATLCLRGDTLIKLTDGRSLPVRDFVDEYAQGNKLEVYSYDVENAKIVPGHVSDARATKQVSELYRVTLDNDEVIECTDNHPFLMKNGEYVRADKLSIGDGVMPLYTRLSSKADGDLIDGYEQLWHDGEWKYTHKIMYHEKCDGNYQVKKQRVIHHIDCDKHNNATWNLMEMDWYSHRRWHANNLESTLMRPDVIAKREPVRIAALQTPEYREKSRQQMIKQSTTPGDPLYEWIHGDEISRVMSKVMTRVWQRPEYRALKVRQNHERWQDEEFRASHSGDNHWCTKRWLCWSIDELVGWCKQNGVTEKKQFLNHVDRPFSIRSLDRWLQRNGFGRWRVFARECLNTNHKIVNIEIIQLDKPEWVYDITVDEHHNFALTAGVFVHNSQEDIRFSRTINTIQKIVISELNKIAAVHLYANGFEGDDLLDFQLHLSNPSTVAQQQKLELYRSRFEIAGTVPEGLVDRYYVRKNVFGMTDEEIKRIEKGIERDFKLNAWLASIGEAGEEGLGGGGAGGAGGDLFSAQDREPSDDEDTKLLTSRDDDDLEEDDEDDFRHPSNPLHAADDENSVDGNDRPGNRGDPGIGVKGPDISGKGPVRVNPEAGLKRSLHNTRRHRHHGASQTHMPDFGDMLDPLSPQDRDVFDRRALGIDTDVLRGEALVRSRGDDDDEAEFQNALDGTVTEFVRMTREMESTLKGVPRVRGKNNYNRSVLTEGYDEDDEGYDEELDLTVEWDLPEEDEGE